MSNFAFLLPEFPTLHAEAARAEELAVSDPRAACFYARRGLELSVKWLYKFDSSLRIPYDDALSALIHEASFRQLVGDGLFTKARLIKDLGNLAAHSAKQLSPQDGITAVRELFHFAFWLARTYGRKHRPPDALQFNASLLPLPSGEPPISKARLEKLQAEMAAKDAQVDALLSGKADLDEELRAAREELAQVRAAAQLVPDTHDYSEAQTRDYFIDLLLKEAGWSLTQEGRDVEYPVKGMPNDAGEGFVDYVCWAEDGKPLALVEAKRTKMDSRVGQQQARLYADCLEQMHGQRPVIYYSNGYEHWIWDDKLYPSRRVAGFHKPDELELLIQRRTTRKPIAATSINAQIVERPYQTRAIRRIAESFERDNMRKALVVMATGAGKTRTVIALCELLKRCNWAKRVLFLADRDALVNQALRAFKQNDPNSSPVDLRVERSSESRTCLCTHQTMMGLIDEARDGKRTFGIGHFDLVVIDEAHRSVYKKYGAIFDYFDSYLVGLTATPKDQVDHNTYKLFDLEDGVPTDSYSLAEAVADGFLVPPRAVSAPLQIPTQGLDYDALTQDEKDRWDALEWTEDGDVPDRVETEAVHNWFFSSDTADKGLEFLMREGLKVEGGDKLGKTIIFAKNANHAEFLAERFNTNYPWYKGEFARVITFKTRYAQSLIDDFSDPAKLPQIAISVDMLDTGIDVPEVINLVFFKQVRSKTKFWQMVGRGTRLCRNLFGPGQDKDCFYIFDYCRNLEYFKEDPAQASGRAQDSLGKRLFVNRLELLKELSLPTEATDEEREQAHELREVLHAEVEGMSLDNFIVRPRRRLVEAYSNAERWQSLSGDDYVQLAEGLAGLPSSVAAQDTDELAKRFDLFMYRLQLKLLQADEGYLKQRDQLIKMAEMLSEQIGSIPAVREQAQLLENLQSEEWWQDVTAPMLDLARKRLRSLVKLLPTSGRMPVYTSFADAMGEATVIELPGLSSGVDQARYLAKVRQYLQSQLEHPVIHKIRWMEPLTDEDLEDLEQLLVASGIGSLEDAQRAADGRGLGEFIRSLVGLDGQAAQRAFAEFLEDKTLTSNQVEFIDLIIRQLTEFGAVQLGQLFASPYTDICPTGPQDLFKPPQLESLIRVVRSVSPPAAY